MLDSNHVSFANRVRKDPTTADFDARPTCSQRRRLMTRCGFGSLSDVALANRVQFVRPALKRAFEKMHGTAQRERLGSTLPRTQQRAFNHGMPSSIAHELPRWLLADRRMCHQRAISVHVHACTRKWPQGCVSPNIIIGGSHNEF